MKPLHIILALFLFGAASAHSQTLKTLSYNTTNGRVVYSGTNSLTFTNALQFATNARAATRTNLELGATWLTNTNVTNFRTAIGLGTAATNPATAFQPASANLTNLASNNAINLTNFSALLLRTNGSAVGLTNFPASVLLTNGSAVGLTNFPASVLLTNGSAAGLTSFPASVLLTNGSANGLTNFPALNQNTTGTASNVTGVVALANGGTGATNAATARTSLGATTVGTNLFTLANPSAIRFLRINADNTASALSDSDFRTAIGLGATNIATFARANIGTTDGTLLWFGLPAQLSVQGTDGRHTILANAPAGGGAAVIGTSSSGGAAGKFYQDSTYTSPALWVSRQTSSTNSPTLGVGSSITGPTSAKAVSVSHGAEEVFFVRYDGAVSSLYQRFGSGSPQGVVSAPVGAVYHRTDGGAGTTFYVKESGAGPVPTSTGWVAK
jgi:hypothetical protein